MQSPGPIVSPPAARLLYARAAIGALAVLTSRLLGLIREQIFAFFFGASREYDAFLAAFRLPNLLRDLLAEGALSTAFVTVFTKELAGTGKERAYRLANSVLIGLSLLMATICALGIAFAPSLIGIIAVGFDPDKLALAGSLARVMFPYIFFASMAAVAMGMLNAQGFYALPQSASSFFNVTSIVVGLIAAYLFSPDYMRHLFATLCSQEAGSGPSGAQLLDQGGSHALALSGPSARAMLGMACGTLMGGLAQWLVQLPLLWRLGWRPRGTVPIDDPGLRAVMRLFGPAVMGAAAVQLSVFVNSNFASLLGDKPMSWLAYSFRLLQFPIGVFGVAIMSAFLPALAREAQAAAEGAFATTLRTGLELVLFFTVPAAVVLSLAGEPMVRLLFEHGRFGREDTLACAAAVAAYALGLPGYSALKVVQPALVARGDARTPMLVTIVGVGCSIGLNCLFLFVFGLGHVGLALSTSVLATGSTLALLWRLERHGVAIVGAGLLPEAARTVLAAAAAGCILGALHLVCTRLLATGEGAGGALVELAVVLPAFVAAYLLVGRALGLRAIAEAGALIARRRKRSAP